MKSKKTKKLTPEQAVGFLDDYRMMLAGLDEKAQPISLRVPANILRAFKTLAKANNNAYQKMMIQALREYLQKR